MPMNSIVTYEKPMPHLSLSDWYNRVNSLRNVADARHNDSFQIRQSACSLLTEIRLEGDWIIFETKSALHERIGEIKRWRLIIGQLHNRLFNQIKVLAEEKSLIEREMEAMQPTMTVLAECLTMRDCRLGAELTYDDADTQIKNELAILENNQLRLNEQCQIAWEKLCRLDEIGFKLNLEVANKKEAEEMDKALLELRKEDASNSFKTTAMRIPANACSYENWLSHVQNIKQLAENELADTSAFRKAMFVCRQKARIMLNSQQEYAEVTIRKRIFETERARNELACMKEKMRDEMEKAVCEIKNLEQAARDKTDALKLAETRLENRAQRSGMELVLDKAHDMLCLEVQKLRNIRESILRKADEAKRNYTLLEDQARKIDVDLANKEHSLTINRRAMEMRSRLKGAENVPASAQTERNIELTRMEKDISIK